MFIEYGCKPSGVTRYLGDGFCNEILNNKECLYDLGDCCLKYPSGSSSFEYWGGPNYACYEASPDVSPNARIVGPLNPSYKVYDRINAAAMNPTSVGMECQNQYHGPNLKFTDRWMK